MTATAPVFTLDPSAPPLVVNLTGFVGGDDVPWPVTVYGFQSGDVVPQMIATFKVAASDADNAPTTVQVLIAPTADGGLTGITTVPLAPTARTGIFPLTSAQAALLAACTVYDVRVWVQRNGSTYDRVVQRGAIAATPNVTDTTSTVATVVVSPASPSIVVGTAQQMTATAYDAKSVAVSGLPVTWVSSNTAIATVDANGKVAALASGTATISATIGGVTQSVTLTVTLHTTQLVAQETVVALIVGHVRNGAYTPKDANGNVTTDPVTYSSSNAAVATVDGSGNITPVAAGGPVTITATCGTVTQSRTLTCYADLVPTFAWEPLSGRAWPRVCATSIGDGNGYSSSEPQYLGAGYYAGTTFRAFPKSTDEWGLGGVPNGQLNAGEDPGGQAAKGATASYVMNTDTLPFNGGGHSMHITFGAASDYFQWGFPLDNSPSPGDPRKPLQRTGGLFLLKAHSAADVGKTVDVGSASANLGQWFSRTTVTLQSATAFQIVPVDYHAQTEEGGSNLMTLAPGSSGTAALTCDMIYNKAGAGIGEDQDAPFGGLAVAHWGVPLEMVSWNTWGPDSDQPPLYNGTTSYRRTFDLAPDATRYYDGSPFTDYWMPSGGGVVSPGLCDLRNVSTLTVLGAGGAVWIGCYVKPGPFGTMPNDGDLQATLVIAGNAHTYGPVNLVRDPVQLRRSTDGASFYRARVPINAANEGYASGTAYIKNATTGELAVTLTRCFVVPEDVRCFGWHESLVPRRNLRVQPPTGVTISTSTTGGTLAAGTWRYVVTALDQAGESLASSEVAIATTGATSSNTLSWAAVSGATGYRVYRGPVNGAAGSENVYYAPGNVTTYTDTNAASTAGTPPTIAPGQLQELAELRVSDVSALLSVDNGFVAMRFVLPFAGGNAFAMGMQAMPGFWQTGPQGSSDYNFDWSLQPNSPAGGQSMVVTMNRSLAGFDGWSAQVQIPNGAQYLPAFTAFDLVVAWQNRQIVAWGIGYGAADYHVTWLDNGSTFLGEIVAWSLSAGAVWTYDQTSYLWGIGGDRDRTRVCGGWLQGAVAGKTVQATQAEFRTVIEEHIRDHWGNRPSY